MVTGKCGISAKIVCDSISEQGKRITTMELTYPRIIHAELLTHRMLSRNSASSRAIPFEKMKEQLTGMPVRFGAANKGMQDKGKHQQLVEFEEPNDGYCSIQRNATPENAWEFARKQAVEMAQAYKDSGYAKQIYNRLTEPFQMMKTLVTATEWDNFFWLRLDEKSVDPTMYELARCMKEAIDESVPTLLKVGEWHLPYVKTFRIKHAGAVCGYYIDGNITTNDVEDAKKVSAARCAAISFRNTDYGLEKSEEVFDKLVDKRVHGSALEHQATPMIPKSGDWSINSDGVNWTQYPDSWQQGISHCDREGQLWSANFAGWIQHRKLIKGENHSE